MIDARMFDDVAEQFAKFLPPGVGAVKADVEKNTKAALQAALGRLELVTREEFDAQAQVLLRTRARLSELEERIAALEGAQNS